MVLVFGIWFFNKYVLVKTIDKGPDALDKGHKIFYQKVFNLPTYILNPFLLNQRDSLVFILMWIM